MALHHPGKLLAENFMSPHGLSQNALARALDVPPRRINEVILGKRKITADTDLRLCHFFGLEPGFWLRLQITSDLDERRRILEEALRGMPNASVMQGRPGFYARLADRRSDDAALRACVEEVVRKLESVGTSDDRPGMLLGRIQSGKTRAFIGVIARAFDRKFDIAVVLTKGTKTLAAQTVARLNADFREEIANDEVLVFDIMAPPGRLIRGELKKKLIIVAKKQADNLARLIRFFAEDYPELAASSVLLVDDEADLASIRFVRKGGPNRVEQGKIAKRLDEFRQSVKSTSFLQVTATPYSLYLQPEGYIDQNNDPIFKPMRPAFTVLLPLHSGYVGGDVYFGARSPDSVEGRLFVPVAQEEQDALRTHDRRRIRADNVLSMRNCAGLARAIVTFVLAACVRQWQQRQAGQRRVKYAMVIHNDTQKAAHAWQEAVTEWIVEAITSKGGESPALRRLFSSAYDDLGKSISISGGALPDYESAFEMFMEAFEGDEVVRERVNSDKDVLALLDDNAELRLRTSFNIFIGGSILDRGITIPNLIAFYYGRNPQTTQADTVLQHSRMYGNRPRADIAVTRLYTSTTVYDRMYTINSFEAALRDAFEREAHDQGVVFIQADESGRVRPCAPNKLLLSDIVAVKPGAYYLPTGFKTRSAKAAAAADKALARLVPDEPAKGRPLTISVDLACEIIAELEKTLVLSNAAFEWGAMKGLLKYYGDKCGDGVALYVERGRRLNRKLSGDKSGVSIVGTTKLRNVLSDPQRRHPALILLQQEGSEALQWAGYKFWWPILAAPEQVEPCVFASRVAAQPAVGSRRRCAAAAAPSGADLA